MDWKNKLYFGDNLDILRREDLARDTHKRNPNLTAKRLNEVVQRLLDRIACVLEPCHGG